MLGNRAMPTRSADEKSQEVYERIEDEFPDYGYEWNHLHSFWTFLKVFRWILNLIFLALPWMLVAQIFMLYNLWFNIKWNFLWAGGNVFLLINTIYMI